ncbi:hypothetical protein FXV91_17180 [Methanosarcina sp. DH2]|uniref:hypothetical protein n=1 Tax=Methanosarcina sp. DH2 TaxID=2605639 RepID=UPI001E33BE08|nr:hypothetical protein [Methanosarcina sp. DH2]MCC4771833.1 hypothetical protein [Methanosarcina sp. DH2]
MYETILNPNTEKYKLLRLKKSDILELFSIFHETYSLKIDNTSFCVDMTIKTSIGEHRKIKTKEGLEKILNEHNDVKSISITILMYDINNKERTLKEKGFFEVTCIGKFELNQTEAKLGITREYYPTLAAGMQSRVNNLLRKRESYLNYFFGWSAVSFIGLFILLIEYFFLIYKQLHGVESLILQIALLGFLGVYFIGLKNKVYREMHVRFDSPEYNDQINEFFLWISAQIKANLVPFLFGMFSTLITTYIAYRLKWI